MVSHVPPEFVVATAPNGKLVLVLLTVILWLNGSLPPKVLLNSSAGIVLNFCAESKEGNAITTQAMKSSEAHRRTIFGVMIECPTRWRWLLCLTANSLAGAGLILVLSWGIGVSAAVIVAILR